MRLMASTSAVEAHSASAFESLPTELGDLILDRLHPAEISRLMQCSSRWDKTLEPRLYGSLNTINRAMFWACTHNHVSLIRKLVTRYDVSPSTVETPISNWHLMDTNWYNRLFIPNVLTLNLVVRKRHVEAFDTLLRLGARIDDFNHDRVSPCQPSFLLRRLCRPPQRTLLVLLFDVIASSQISLSEVQLSTMLMLLITSDAPLDIVTRTLDLGANPNYNHPYINHSAVCALSAAILRNSSSLFIMLIERGADIHGTKHSVVPLIPLHIPIFAAAHVLPKFGPAMMQLCLDKGADINQHASVRVDFAWHHHRTTPIDVFFKSIRPWQSTEDENNLGYFVEALRFLLNNGASLDRQLEEIKAYIQTGRTFVWRPSSHRKMWLPMTINAAHFTAVVKLLETNAALQKSDHSVAVQILKSISRATSDNETEESMQDQRVNLLGYMCIFPALTYHKPYYHEKHSRRLAG
ncbi:hypothetical protein BDV95DRAFT_594102 [Massariosphaeria phaeospora]|uniref:F-box domain-containing protein n=1 Tax=Massariosphaeria phaeospora TaxID=100035 RepID=A0A7C8MAC7_9PLEO|nr:hypothetical protein BDV95DRAFT_594102 [Massariosphaeria phaeospora]